MEYLCERGADVNRGQRSSSLHYAACFGRPAVAKVSVTEEVVVTCSRWDDFVDSLCIIVLIKKITDNFLDCDWF